MLIYFPINVTGPMKINFPWLTVKDKDKFAPLFHPSPYFEGIWGKWIITPCNFSLGTWWWLVNGFTPGWYLPHFPAHKTHFFFRKMVTQIWPASYAPRVSIISKLINTRTAIIQHVYGETVKFASKSWDLASLLVNGILSCNKICNNPVFFQ
jgi:hypothetical protein